MTHVLVPYKACHSERSEAESKNPYSKENGSFDYGLMPFAQDDNIFPEWDQFKQRLHNSPLFLDGKYGIINYYDEFDGRENHAAL